MGKAERVNQLTRLLCRRRYESVQNLAQEFGVSTRTIQRDIEEISSTMPIYTKTGRYGGGVYVVEGYYIDRMYMEAAELAVLEKLAHSVQDDDILTREEKRTLDNIIMQYSKPNLKKGDDKK